MGERGWICYAQPAGQNGRPCRHENPSIGQRACEKCGCTQIASEVRRKRAQAIAMLKLIGLQQVGR